MIETHLIYFNVIVICTGDTRSYVCMYVCIGFGTQNIKCAKDNNIMNIEKNFSIFFLIHTYKRFFVLKPLKHYYVTDKNILLYIYLFVVVVPMYALKKEYCTKKKFIEIGLHSKCLTIIYVGRY